jgi:hypothetical protein
VVYEPERPFAGHVRGDVARVMLGGQRARGEPGARLEDGLEVARDDGEGWRASAAWTRRSPSITADEATGPAHTSFVALTPSAAVRPCCRPWTGRRTGRK